MFSISCSPNDAETQYRKGVSDPIPNRRFQIPDSKSEIPDIPDSKSEIPNIPNPESQIPNPKSQIPNPKSQIVSLADLALDERFQSGLAEV
ncbi:MAG: hypothetical protein IPN69_04475 [Acidobacteria bacterium]|nr:hypothetical protein [Acidobacteriota bacterium]